MNEAEAPQIDSKEDQDMSQPKQDTSMQNLKAAAKVRARNELLESINDVRSKPVTVTEKANTAPVAQPKVQ